MLQIDKMIYSRLATFLITTACVLLCQNILQASKSNSQDIRKPLLDSNKRFWIYGGTRQADPFIPHGWMPAEAASMIKEFNLACHTNPHSSNNCLAVDISWLKYPGWCGVAWMTQEKAKDKSPWWGQDASGCAYNLTSAKQLVVWARGAKGGERIQFKIGILGDKPYGDSTISPIESDWVTLSTKWQKYTINLRGNNLARIANGFTLISSQREQTGSPNQTSFFLDDIYFQF